MQKFRCLFLLVSTLSIAQEAGYLDLVTKSIQGRRTESTTSSVSVGSIGVGGGGQVHWPPQPLQLSVSQVEGGKYKIGEDFVFEIRLTNISDRVVSIPWAPNPRDIEPRKPGPYEYEVARLAPRLVNSSGQVVVLEAVAIYGSDAPSTTLDLVPGNWVRIRAKSRLYSQGPGELTTFLSAKPDAVRLGAVWSLYRVSFAQRNGQYHETFIPSEQEISSTNTVPIYIVLDSGRVARVIIDSFLVTLRPSNEQIIANTASLAASTTTYILTLRDSC